MQNRETFSKLYSFLFSIFFLFFSLAQYASASINLNHPPEAQPLIVPNSRVEVASEVTKFPVKFEPVDSLKVERLKSELKEQVIESIVPEVMAFGDSADEVLSKAQNESRQEKAKKIFEAVFSFVNSSTANPGSTGFNAMMAWLKIGILINEDVSALYQTIFNISRSQEYKKMIEDRKQEFDQIFDEIFARHTPEDAASLINDIISFTKDMDVLKHFELGGTPYDLIEESDLHEVRFYRSGNEKTRLVMTYALLNRADIFDFAPHLGKSVIDFLNKQGVSVYLVNWKTPERDYTLNEYLTRMSDGFDAAFIHGGERPLHLLGYCQGGALSLFALERGLIDARKLQSFTQLAAPVNTGGEIYGSGKWPLAYGMNSEVAKMIAAWGQIRGGVIPGEEFGKFLLLREEKIFKAMTSQSFKGMMALLETDPELRVFIKDNLENIREAYLDLPDGDLKKRLGGFLTGAVLTRWVMDNPGMALSSWREFNSLVYENNYFLQKDVVERVKAVVEHTGLPCFVFTGEKDDLVPPASSKGLMDILGEDKVSLIEAAGAGHVALVMSGSVFKKAWLPYAEKIINRTEELFDGDWEEGNLRHLTGIHSPVLSEMGRAMLPDLYAQKRESEQMVAKATYLGLRDALMEVMLSFMRFSGSATGNPAGVFSAGEELAVESLHNISDLIDFLNKTKVNVRKTQDSQRLFEEVKEKFVGTLLSLENNTEVSKGEMARIVEDAFGYSLDRRTLKYFKLGGTPFEVVHDGHLQTLRYYRAANEKTAVFMNYALINRAEILDFAPELGRSVIQSLNEQGISVYLGDWKSPAYDYSLDDYLEEIARSLNAASEHAGGPLHVLGYCQGGSMLIQAIVRGYVDSGDFLSFTQLAAPIDVSEELIKGSDWAVARDLNAQGTSLLEAGADYRGVLSGDEFTKFLLMREDSVFRKMTHENFKKTLNALLSSEGVREFVREHKSDIKRAIKEKAADLPDENVETLISVIVGAMMNNWVMDTPPLSKSAWKEFVTEVFLRNELGSSFTEAALNRELEGKPVVLFTAQNDDLVAPSSTNALGRMLPHNEVLKISVPTGHTGFCVSEKADEGWQTYAEFLLEKTPGRKAETSMVGAAPSLIVEKRHLQVMENADVLIRDWVKDFDLECVIAQRVEELENYIPPDKGAAKLELSVHALEFEELAMGLMAHGYVHHLLADKGYTEAARCCIASIIEMNFLIRLCSEYDKDHKQPNGTRLDEIVNYLLDSSEIYAPIESLLRNFSAENGGVRVRQAELIKEIAALHYEEFVFENTDEILKLVDDLDRKMFSESLTDVPAKFYSDVLDEVNTDFKKDYTSIRNMKQAVLLDKPGRVDIEYLRPLVEDGKEIFVYENGWLKKAVIKDTLMFDPVLQARSVTEALSCIKKEDVSVSVVSADKGNLLSIHESSEGEDVSLFSVSHLSSRLGDAYRDSGVEAAVLPYVFSYRADKKDVLTGMNKMFIDRGVFLEANTEFVSLQSDTLMGAIREVAERLSKAMREVAGRMAIEASA